MVNNLDIEIDIPETYSNKGLTQQSQAKDINVTEVPNSTNKVKKIVIRGVLKHDAAHS
jgi:hypothetical protein